MSYDLLTKVDLFLLGGALAATIVVLGLIAANMLSGMRHG
jgi:hypothetical protein